MATVNETEKGVTKCFLEMLREIHGRTGTTTEAKESLEVVMQLIEDLFGLTTATEQKQPLLGGRKLVDLFQEATRKEEEEEPGFEKFKEVLKSKGFFSGLTEGTPEFTKRLTMARGHFSKAKQQQTTAPKEEEDEKKKRERLFITSAHSPICPIEVQLFCHLEIS